MMKLLGRISENDQQYIAYTLLCLWADFYQFIGCISNREQLANKLDEQHKVYYTFEGLVATEKNLIV